MSDERISLTEWIKKVDNGDFDNRSVDTMIDAGWFDWFCKDESLYPRYKRMIGMVKAAADSDLVDPDEVYVFFKNNAPCSGGTYDSFSLCNLKTQDVIWWVTAKSGHTNSAIVIRSPFFGDSNNLLSDEHRKGATDVKNFFKKTEFKTVLAKHKAMNAQLTYARDFYHNMITALVDNKYFEDRDEAYKVLRFFDDLQGEGPAIIKDGTELEMLGLDICVNLDKGKYISIEDPDPEGGFFAEPVNAELMRFPSV